MFDLLHHKIKKHQKLPVYSSIQSSTLVTLPLTSGYSAFPQPIPQEEIPIRVAILTSLPFESLMISTLTTGAEKNS